MGLRDDVRKMGLAGWAAYAADRALARLSNERAGFLALRFFVQPVASKPLVPSQEGSTVRIGRIDEGVFAAEAFARPEEAISDRFKHGSICIGASRGRELLGFLWLQEGVLHERLVRCRMHAEPQRVVAWDYDFFIDPNHRLGRLFGRLWDSAFETLRERNILATVSWIRLGNRHSELAHSKLGARPVGWAVFIFGFGRQLMLSSLKPRLHYSGPGEQADLLVDVKHLLNTPNPD